MVCRLWEGVYLSLCSLDPCAVCDSGGLQSRVEGAAEVCQGLPAGEQRIPQAGKEAAQPRLELVEARAQQIEAHPGLHRLRPHTVLNLGATTSQCQHRTGHAACQVDIGWEGSVEHQKLLARPPSACHSCSTCTGGLSGRWTHLVGDRVLTIGGPVNQGVRQDCLHEQQQRPAVVAQAQQHGFTAAAEGAFRSCDSQSSLPRD